MDSKKNNWIRSRSTGFSKSVYNWHGYQFVYIFYLYASQIWNIKDLLEIILFWWQKKWDRVWSNLTHSKSFQSAIFVWLVSEDLVLVLSFSVCPQNSVFSPSCHHKLGLSLLMNLSYILLTICRHHDQLQLSFLLSTSTNHESSFSEVWLNFSLWLFLITSSAYCCIHLPI